MTPKTTPPTWPDAGLQPGGHTYITGTGQRLNNVHRLVDVCTEEGCVIHNPTDPYPERPTHWLSATRQMVRVCVCGVMHPDKDDAGYHTRHGIYLPPHECCVHGCYLNPPVPMLGYGATP